MVTGEVIQQVFRIARERAEGTAFTVAVANRQYLVTCRHVLDNDGALEIPDSFELEIQHNRQWKPVRARTVGFLSDPHDVAVVALEQTLAEYTQVSLGCPDVRYGEDVYFLGFPFGQFGDFGSTNSGYPFPYIKRAIVSMLAAESQGQPLYVLDGINNKGFSGGPVVVAREGSWTLIGVVLGYQSVAEDVVQGERATGLSTHANTGLIEACPIQKVLQIILNSPIGPTISI